MYTWFKLAIFNVTERLGYWIELSINNFQAYFQSYRARVMSASEINR